MICNFHVCKVDQVNFPQFQIPNLLGLMQSIMVQIICSVYTTKEDEPSFEDKNGIN